MRAGAPTPRTVPVLIVGGGPVGLSASVLLSRLGVENLLVERDFDTADHPQARSLNLRTMEIYRLWGIESELRSVSLPAPWARQLVYTKTLAGEELGRTRSKATGQRHRLTPAPYLLSGQDRIEPILRRRAESYEEASIAFGVALEEIRCDAEGVLATITHRERGEREQVRARFAIAADGVASTVRRSLGIPMVGERDLATSVSTYFRADLGRYVNDRPAGLYWVASEAARGVFQPIDGKDTWLCQIGFTDDPEGARVAELSAEEARAWIHAAIGDDTIPVEVHNTKRWTMGACFAERFREGPLFLAGDAAHQLPITGGFGLNTGVQDVHNLAWKLAYTLRGDADPALLDTYEEERRPVAEWVSARCLENYHAAMRVTRAALTRGTDREDRAETVRKTQRYGNWLGMDLGVRYERGALVPDGTPPPAVDDPVQEYVPCARPGHRAPHVPLRQNGQDVSPLDWFEKEWVLIGGEGADGWIAGGERLRSQSPLRVVQLGSGEIEDTDDLWQEHYATGDAGAVLVRPDGVVAWRSTEAPRDAARELRAVFQAMRIVVSS